MRSQDYATELGVRSNSGVTVDVIEQFQILPKREHAVSANYGQVMEEITGSVDSEMPLLVSLTDRINILSYLSYL